jgi:hypothetical protein
MPIEITPQGEYINPVTGNPVGIPPQRPDIPRGGGAMSDQEMNMMRFGMDIAGGNVPQSDMTDIDKVRLLMDMGLNEQDALEAVVRERAMGTVRPEEFSGARESAMQQQTPMTRPQTMGGQQMPQQLGALPQTPPQAPPPRPDMSGMSREQMDMLRRGIDPFAEGMVK